MAAYIKFFINCSNCSKNGLQSGMQCSFILRSQRAPSFYKSLRCVQSPRKLAWEGNCILRTSQVGQLLAPQFHSTVLCKSMNEDRKEKSKNEFLKMIYTAEKGVESQESAEVSKGEYYTQVWLSNKPRFEEIHEEDGMSKTDEETSESSHIFSKALPENTFGTLSGIDPASSDNRDHNERIEEMFEDEEETDRDWRKNIPLTKYGRRNKPVEFYNRHIKMFASQGKIKEAIAVFDRWMMIEDRVRPKKTTFIILMTFLSKVGYTRKTFQLFRQMKQLGLDPPPLIHTLLFYSCENCPMPEYGLKRANNLYHHLKDMEIAMSLPTLKSAIRAFGKCGNFAKAFQILDENLQSLDIEVFNALLMACVSDKKAGFKRAIQVWLLMRQHNIKPVDISYNLLAHCMRDSGIGDPSNFVSDLALNSDSLDGFVSEIEIFDKEKGSNIFLNSTSSYGAQQQFLPLEGGDGEYKTETMGRNLSGAQSFPAQICPEDLGTNGTNTVIDSEKVAKIFIDKRNATSLKYVSEDNISTSSQRNFTSINSDANESSEVLHQFTLPDKFINVPLYSNGHRQNFPPQTVMERQLTVQLSDLKSSSGRLSLLGGMESFLSDMRNNDVQPITKTFSLLLASLPNNKESERKLMKMMEWLGETPDIDFLNDMMMRRNRRNESRTLKEILQFISRFRLTPNMRTYAALAISCHKEEDGLSLIEDMKAANVEPTEVVMGHFILASRFNFGYKLRLLRMMEELNIEPSKRLIMDLEKSIARVKSKIVQAEKKRDADWFVSTPFQESFRKFLRFYRSWLKRTEIHRPRHPWDGLEESFAVEDNGEDGKSQRPAKE